MRIVEYQHRSEAGGNFVLLDNDRWGHGEMVLVVPKLELRAFLRKTKKLLNDNGVLSRDVDQMLEQIDKL